MAYSQKPERQGGPSSRTPAADLLLSTYLTCLIFALLQYINAVSFHMQAGAIFESYLPNVIAMNV
jgi:hypothetical protein